MERKSYDIKFFGGRDFVDYWNLQEHPLYVSLEKKKPYFNIRELSTEGFEKVDSLHSLANFLRKNDWVFQSRYWSYISNEVQAAINIPYFRHTKLTTCS